MLYLALLGLAAWLAFSLYVTIAIFVEYAHNARRTLFEALALVPAVTLLAALVASLVIVPTFVPTQILLGAFLFTLRRQRWTILVACLVPAVAGLALVSFECFDHLAPSDRFFTDPSLEWEHGLTGRRLLVFVGLQAILTAFGLWRLHKGGLLAVAPSAHGRPASVPGP